MPRVTIVIVLSLILAACGGGTPTAVPAPAKDASTVNIQATVDAAVKATTAAQPKAAAPVQPTAPPAVIAPTAVPPTVAPTTAPKAPAPTPTEWVINGITVRKTGCKMGDLCVTPDETLAVRATEAQTSDTTGNQFIKPGPNNTYLLVNVIIGNFGKNPMAYNPLYAKVKDASGREYQSNIMATSSIAGALQSGTLTSSDTVQGIIAFEVPKGSQGFRLTYQPLVFPQPPAIVIELGQ